MASDEVTSFVEIQSWCEQSGIDMNIWERESMKFISSCYISSLNESSEPDTPRPYLTEASLPKIQDEESARVRAALMSKVKK